MMDWICSFVCGLMKIGVNLDRRAVGMFWGRDAVAWMMRDGGGSSMSLRTVSAFFFERESASLMMRYLNWSSLGGL